MAVLPSVGASILLVLGGARAERTRVAVLPVESHATLPDSHRVELRRQVEQGIGRAEVEVVRDQLVDEQIDDEGCESVRCAVALATALDVAWIVRPTITEADSVYEIEIEAVDEHGQALASASERCEICGYREVSDLVLDRSAALGAKVALLRRRVPRVALRSEPSGARVWIDGRFAGRTPLEQELEVGEHEVRVTLPGHASEHRRITAVAGTADTLSFTMVERPEPLRRPRPWLGVGAASLATGVVSLGAGIGLVAIDEREYERRCNPDPLGNCSHRFDTLAGGAMLIASGGALLAAGVVALVIDRRRHGRGSRHARKWGTGGLAISF